MLALLLGTSFAAADLGGLLKSLSS